MKVPIRYKTIKPRKYFGFSVWCRNTFTAYAICERFNKNKTIDVCGLYNYKGLGYHWCKDEYLDNPEIFTDK